MIGTWTARGQNSKSHIHTGASCVLELLRSRNTQMGERDWESSLQWGYQPAWDHSDAGSGHSRGPFKNTALYYIHSSSSGMPQLSLRDSI